ncbi:MAG: polysaccharide deacetylase family protein [Actinomycetota bacterium]
MPSDYDRRRAVRRRALSIRRFAVRSVAATLVIALASVAGVRGSPPVGLETARRGASVQARQLPTVPAPFAAPRVKWPVRGQVAVTFDDGPCVVKTRKTVDVLGDTPATFFVVGGQVRRTPSEARYAASRGHSIQNHTMDHHRLRRLDATEIARQLSQTADLIEATVGVRPVVYRPPYGSTDQRVLSATSALGWYEAMWNGGAPRMDSKAPQIIGAVRGQMQRARSANIGLVLLFHDCSGSFNGMINALPTVIKMLRDDGWEFVTFG